jgi:endonuclease-3 related protein
MKKQLRHIYDNLFTHFGPQGWWPAETSFEVAVGAILTQNTNWGNVEKAIQNLRMAGKLSPDALHTMTHKRLASLIRPAGYFNVKARRLKNFLQLFISVYDGDMTNMKRERLPVIKEKLLSVNGIGQETADSIILYALEKPVFVVDAYTKRVLSRHALLDYNLSYDRFQGFFHAHLRKNVKFYNEFHALFVRLSKEYCRTTPLCKGCPIEGI